jgi:anthranilate phosphoribosyltransferase
MNLEQAAKLCALGGELPHAEIAGLAALLTDETEPEGSKANFLRVFSDKGETPNELAAFAEAFLPNAVNPGFGEEFKGKVLFDCCGTGGGGLDLFNVSTGLIFILAARGVPVVKHGNRAVTKKTGSADVLEALGIRIAATPEQAQSDLDAIGAAFLFAPFFHPSFKVLVPIRKMLALEGKRTVFNLLGPLLNPARPATQMIGVFNTAHLELFDKALFRLGRRRHLVVHGSSAELAPLGEASSFGPTLVKGRMNGLPIEDRFSATLQGSLDELLVQTPRASAERIEAILCGKEQGLARGILMFNAALAFWTHGTAIDLDRGYALAADALDSGDALSVLDKWRAASAR